MLCENCNKNEATIKISQEVNGEKNERNLCQSCAGMDFSGSNMNFDSIVQGFLNSLISQNFIKPSQEESFTTGGKTCPYCGMSFGEITKTGKIGCASCYETFKPELTGIINNIHGSHFHQGKFPQKSGKELLTKKKIEDLRKELNNKIKLEEYEEAAKIRDEIKELEGGIPSGK